MVRMGRPRNFDRDQAVQDAMFLFWEHGFESTSLRELTAKIGGGISTPSFYAAFGSKELLFYEVIDLYNKNYGYVSSSLWSKSLSPRYAIERVLRRLVEMQSDPCHPKGCLLVTGAANCQLDNRHIQAFLAQQRARILQGYELCIRKGIENGQLISSVDTSALAKVFCSYHFGIAMLSRDGASLDELDRSVSLILALWDVNTLRMLNSDR